MPQAIPAIVAWWAAYGAYVYYAVVVISTVYSLTNRPSVPNVAGGTGSTAAADGGQQANTSLISAPLPIIYGETRVGVNRVYVGTSSSNNSLLHVVSNICEGEIEGISQVGGVAQIFLNDKLHTSYGSNFYYEFFNGSPTQAASATLHTAIPEWNERKKRTAYIYSRYTYDNDVYQGMPDITVLLKGMKVYNPDTGLTAYSNNPALCALDFLVRSSRRGGMGFDISRIDLDSVMDAAAYCVAKGWTCNLYLSENQSASDNFLHILATFRGALVYSGSVFKLKYKDLNYESVVMNFTEDDVVEQGTSTLRIVQPSIFSTPNAVNCTYPNAENNYQFDNYVLVDNAAISADGDYREEQIALNGVTNIVNVQKMANFFLEKLRLNKTASFMTGSRAIPIEPMDLVTLTHSRPGWVGKIFRVSSPAIAADGTVTLSLEEEFSSMYDDTYNLTSHVWRDTNLPDPSIVLSPGTPTIAEEMYVTEVGSWGKGKFTISWAASLDTYLRHYQAEYKLSGSADYIQLPPVGGTSVDVMGLSPGTYDIRVKAVNVAGSSSGWATNTVTLLQSDWSTAWNPGLSNFSVVANGSFVDFSWRSAGDWFSLSYEIREGDTWETGEVLVSDHRSSQYSWQPTSAGNKKFWLKPLDKYGVYSVGTASVTLAINSPVVSGLSQQVIDNNVLLSWTATPGTFAIDRAEVRRGTTFSTAEVIGRIDGTFTVIFETAAGTYKYWVALEDISGLYGVEVGVYAVVNQPPDYILYDNRPLALTGTKTNIVLDGGVLIAPVNSAETYQQHFVNHSWTTPQAQVTAGHSYFIQPATATGTYVETIDYGGTIPATKISLTLTRTTIAGTVTVTPTIETSLNGTDWATYAGVYECYATSFRYVRITVAFATSDNGFLNVTGSLVRLDVKKKRLQGSVAAVSTDVGGTSVDIAGQFIDVSSIVVSAQSTSPVYSVYNFVDVANPTSFKVLIFNSAGTRISGPVSYTVEGV